MPLTESNMMPIGTPAPNFSLLDTVSRQTLTLNTLKSEVATVIMFICNHCKYVKHINPMIVDIVSKFKPLGVSFIGISSNDVVEFPEDSPTEMTKTAKNLGYDFPYLYDETQDVAKAYDAACTPEFFIFDKEMKLVYRGRMDGSSPKNDVPLTGSDLRGALRALVADDYVSEIQYPSMGCSIKWKA